MEVRLRDEKKQLGAIGESAYDRAVSRGATPQEALATALATERQAAERISAGFSSIRHDVATGAGFEVGMFSGAFNATDPIDIASTGGTNLNGVSLNGTDLQGRVVGVTVPGGGSGFEINKAYPGEEYALPSTQIAASGDSHLMGLSDALYLPGPIAVSRFDFGPASLGGNSALNIINSAANAGLNAFGGIGQYLEPYQGEIVTAEVMFGSGFGQLPGAGQVGRLGGYGLAALTNGFFTASRSIRGATDVNRAGLALRTTGNIEGLTEATLGRPTQLQQGISSGFANFIPPRSAEFGDVVTVGELRVTGGFPGPDGVLIKGGVTFDDLFDLSTLNGREIEFGLGARVNAQGGVDDVVFSGGYLNGKAVISFPSDVYPIAHVHPIPGPLQHLPSQADLASMQGRVSSYLADNPGAAIPPHYVIYGTGDAFTAFSPLPFNYFSRP